MIWWALGEVVGETVGIEGDRLVQLVDNKDYIYIIQMSKVDKQDVLKAILNVKMYAKNLKVMIAWWREMLPQIKR